MVTIRLNRGGMKKTPFYQIIVTDSRSRRDGRFIERLGFFNPVACGKSQRLELDMGRVEYWLGTGAQTSERVKSLIKQYQKQLASASQVADQNTQAAEQSAQPSAIVS